MSLFERDQWISFGDCDPAGIVYYPNYFKWMDMTFHALMARHGGHAELCRSLGSRGIGLMEATLAFRSPGYEGQTIRYGIERIEWSGRAFDIHYRATEGARLVLEGRERRGVFVARDGRLAAGDVAPLRAALGQNDG